MEAVAFEGEGDMKHGAVWGERQMGRKVDGESVEVEEVVHIWRKVNFAVSVG